MHYYAYVSIPVFSRYICTTSPLALIVTEQRCFANRKRKRSVSHDFTSGGIQAGDKSSEEKAKEQMEVVTKSVVCGIVTRIDLLEFISHDGDGVTKSEF